MSTIELFLIGVFTTALLAVFVCATVGCLKKAAAWRTSQGTVASLIAGAPHPLKVLLATDGSSCSDRAVRDIAARPWPANSEVEVVTVVHTRIPLLPEPAFILAAGHVEALETDRTQAPERIQRAEQCLASNANLRVTSKVLEGDPQKEILKEASQWAADLVVVGSHGYGLVKRHLLGSVSQAVALHAPCSVEIVRQAHDGG